MLLQDTQGASTPLEWDHGHNSCCLQSVMMTEGNIDSHLLTKFSRSGCHRRLKTTSIVTKPFSAQRNPITQLVHLELQSGRVAFLFTSSWPSLTECAVQLLVCFILIIMYKVIGSSSLQLLFNLQFFFFLPFDFTFRFGMMLCWIFHLTGIVSHWKTELFCVSDLQVEAFCFSSSYCIFCCTVVMSTSTAYSYLHEFSSFLLNV